MRVDLDIDVFDPADLAKLYGQDYVLETYGSYPTWPRAKAEVDYRADGSLFAAWNPPFRHLTDSELTQLVVGLRSAVPLPFTDNFLHWMRDLLRHAEQEARRRLSQPRRSEEWRRADLLAEVEARAGEGRRRGKAWWFRCPWHEDKTASLEVDGEKRVWHCFGCGKAGGVVDWRKLCEGT